MGNGKVQLFNVAVFMPKLKMPEAPLVLKYGRHAQEAALDDRYGNLAMLLPKQLKLADVEVVELELTDGKVTKMVVRVPAVENLDLVMVVQPDGFVRTVWGNRKNDKHKTLDRAKYATKVGA